MPTTHALIKEMRWKSMQERFVLIVSAGRHPPHVDLPHAGRNRSLIVKNLPEF